MATDATRKATGGKRPGRWWRRWIIACLVWAVPVAALGLKEMVSEMLYDSADINVSLNRWVLSDAQRTLPHADQCTGAIDAARQAGCPPPIVDANAALRDAALGELHVRRVAQITGFFQAVVVYWALPCAIVLGIGLVCGLIGRALRRPASTRPAMPSAQAGATPVAANGASPIEPPRS